MNSRILLVEGEPGLVLTISDLLVAEGYEVHAASDGEAALAKAAAREFDVVILDVMLPKKTGLDVCRELRQRGIDSAILMLTAKNQIVDRVVGLKLGADDYLAKPFDPAELLARVEVVKGGHPVSLAAKELQLLRYLVIHRDRVVPREEILQKVWEYGSDVSSRTVDVHVAWLRQKLDNPQNPKHIQTVRGKGYRFTV